MLQARWTGYEIDSSEAAYEVAVSQPEQLGTLVRSLLGSGYFVRSYTLLFEEPLERLRDFILSKGDQSDPLTAQALKHLQEQIDKFNSRRLTTIGVRAIEPILNYVGAHRKELVAAKTFRFELTPDQKEMFRDYGHRFRPGQRVNETDYYSEEEIPLDGVVLFLGCELVKLTKLPPEDQPKARRIGKEVVKDSGLEDFGFGFDFFGGGGRRDMVMAEFDRPQSLTLRVRLQPNATCMVTGRWMDDGQFAYPYYVYLLEQAADKAKAKIDFTMVYG
jgi:hypothetical protein